MDSCSHVLTTQDTSADHTTVRGATRESRLGLGKAPDQTRLREMLVLEKGFRGGRGESGSTGRCLYLCAINGFAVFPVAFSVLDR